MSNHLQTTHFQFRYTNGITRRRVDRIRKTLANRFMDGKAVLITLRNSHITAEEINSPRLLSMQSTSNHHHLLATEEETEYQLLNAIYKLVASKKYKGMLVTFKMANSLEVCYYEDVAKLVRPFETKPSTTDASEPLITPENIASFEKSYMKSVVLNSECGKDEMIRRVDGHLVKMNMNGKFLELLGEV